MYVEEKVLLLTGGAHVEEWPTWSIGLALPSLALADGRTGLRLAAEGARDVQPVLTGQSWRHGVLDCSRSRRLVCVAWTLGGRRAPRSPLRPPVLGVDVLARARRQHQAVSPGCAAATSTTLGGILAAPGPTGGGATVAAATCGVVPASSTLAASNEETKPDAALVPRSTSGRRGRTATPRPPTVTVHRRWSPHRHLFLHVVIRMCRGAERRRCLPVSCARTGPSAGSVVSTGPPSGIPCCRRALVCTWRRRAPVLDGCRRWSWRGLGEGRST